MSTPPVIPSKNPADDGNIGGTLNTIFRKREMKSEGQLPAIVISYNRAANQATVRPLIRQVRSDGRTIQRASIAIVPVLALGGGGFCMTFPLKPGDLGWIEASDRDISLFVQSLKESPPGTWRIKRFSDGRFIPDAFRHYTFESGTDSNSAVIQSYDGSVRIALDPTALRLIAPTVTISATTAFSVTAPAITLNQTGGGAGATFTGSPVVMPDAIINGVRQSTHIHDDPQGGEVGPPHN